MKRASISVQVPDGTVLAGTARVGIGIRGLKAGRSFQRMASFTVHLAGDSTHRFSSTGLRSFTVHGVTPPTILAISMDRMATGSSREVGFAAAVASGVEADADADRHESHIAKVRLDAEATGARVRKGEEVRGARMP